MNTIIKKIKVGVLILIPQLLVSSGCNKNNNSQCIFGGYSFIVSSSWIPQKEVYNINDTLKLR
jgi:hypothetical protein